MYLEVYPDVVFLINFFVDLVLIFLVKKVNRKNSSMLRIILAAITGGICAAIVSVYPWMNTVIKFLLMYVATSSLMIVIAFGKLKLSDILKQWIVLNLITYFVGGFMNSIYYHTNFRMILISIGNKNIFSNISSLYIIVVICLITIVTLFALWLLRQYQIHKPLVYDVELVLEERHIRTRGLMDTGNCLFDPTLGKPVMIMDNSLIDELMSPDIKQDMELAMSYLDGKSDETSYPNNYDNIVRFSFIPYRSIGKTGMLLAIRLDKVMIHTENESICNER
ncbi:MAG: sigma-E processing peptidase SpoIIGA, partial [Herbinix sp.]|nr:sigma-E processing peptidase SpoIIGA [Herbinix sp.]